MKKKYLWLVVSCLMALSLVIASCGPAVEEEEETGVEVTEEEQGVVVEEEEEEVVKKGEPQYGGWITYTSSTFASVTGWDDAITSHYRLTNRQPYGARLLISDWPKGPVGTGEYIFFTNDAMFITKMGQIAESWEIFEEGRVVYHIRPGIHYAVNPDTDHEASRLVGGRELTADDVVYNLTRVCTVPTSYVKTSCTIFCDEVEITALDKYTVEVVSSPEETMGGAYFFATYVFVDTPKEVVDKYGDMGNWKNQVGAGPFILTDYVAGSSLTYARNDNYFMKDSAGAGVGNQLPYADGVKMLLIPDPSTCLAALRTGKVDFRTQLRSDDAESLMETNPELKYVAGLGQSSGVMMRTDKPELPYDDIRVRQALMMATDFETIKKALMAGYGVLPHWPLSWQPEIDDYFLHLDEMEPATRELFTYNPDKAKEYLTEAGYPDGFKADIIVRSSPPLYLEEVQVIKDMWGKVGVELNIQPMEAGSYMGVTRGATHEDMIYSGWGTTSLIWVRGAGNVDERTTFNLSLIDEEYVKKGRRDMMAAWLSSDYEELYRISKYDLIANLIWESWVIPYPQPPYFNFWWPWLHNFEGATGMGSFAGPPYQYMWIDQDMKKSMGY